MQIGRVEFLYYPGCPSHEQALDRFHSALRDEGILEQVDVICVESSDQAESSGFSGSPTFRIGGVDLFAETDSGQPALTCRVYYKADGTPTPLPSIDMLRAAIRKAMEGRQK